VAESKGTVEGLVVTPRNPTEPVSASAYFGERAAYYDSKYDARDVDGHALRARAAAALRLAGDGPGNSLDAGMGPGRLCAALEEQGWTVAGVDASPEMVDTARFRLPAARDRLLVARIEKLPFSDHSFDLVTATGVLEYSTVPAALAELSRVLKPGGHAVLSYPNPEAYYGIWKTRVWYPAVRMAKRILRRSDPHMPRGAGCIRPAMFRELLAAAHLTPQVSVYTSFSPLPAPLDQLLPRTSQRLGALLEGRGGLAARLLATQVVFLARLQPAEDPGREQTS
jgi:ubiquinone/menaquinone biosynthesis C-methylase UbiE